jgi:hypothetical protein
VARPTRASTPTPNAPDLDHGSGRLAPLQFLVFLVSLALVLRFMWTGAGYAAATISIVVKTFILY